MKNSLIAFLSLTLLFGCTQVEVNESLPSIDSITPITINSQLKRIDITADEEMLATLFAFPSSSILVPCTTTFYSKTGQVVFANQTGTLEIKGAGSANFPMKPLGILFDQPQDNSSGQIVNPDQILPGDDVSQLINIRMRNSGNDYGRTTFKDLAYTEFAVKNELNLEVKYGEPIHVFINGEYYGLENTRTEGDIEPLCYLLNTDTSNITYMKVDIKNGNLEYKSGNEVLGTAFENAIKSFDTKALKALIDIDNYIDYILYEDYISNDDWPGNNAAAYSVNGNKFRFFLYDLDQAAIRTKNPVLPELEYLSADVAKIYQALFQKDEEFTQKLDARQKELYKQFSPEDFNAIVEKRARIIENEIPYLISRRAAPASTMQWRVELETLKRDFERTDFNNRKHYDLN